MFKFPKLVALLMAVLVSNSRSAAKDDTLAEWTQGREITEAVIRKIQKSNIFPEDNSFLLRLAYVESKFGENENTFRTDYYGGIWQVEESVFRITQTNHSSLFPLHKAIQSKFEINWTELTWKNLITPMYSGLAAALYFARVPERIPDTTQQQSQHWIKYYRPLGNGSKFIEDSEELRNQTRCRGKMDLCIVLDGSGSINQHDPSNYGRAKDFVASMIESFTLDFTRMGMVVYSTEIYDIFEINNNRTIEQLAQLAKNATYPNKGTRTDLAIRRAIRMFNSSSIIDNGVPKIMTVFTDGNSDRGSDMNGAVNEMRNNGIKSVAIGIGGAINPTELLLIALDDTRSVFRLSDFNALQDFLQIITSVACDTPQKPALNTTYNDTLLEKEKRLYTVELPPEGVTITVAVSIGKTNGYWSRTEEVPSSAVHDGTIDGPTFIPALITAKHSKENEASGDSVYFTIQGIEATNDYTLTMAEGNTRGGDESGAAMIKLTNYIAFLLIVLHTCF